MNAFEIINGPSKFNLTAFMLGAKKVHGETLSFFTGHGKHNIQIISVKRSKIQEGVFKIKGIVEVSGVYKQAQIVFSPDMQEGTIKFSEIPEQVDQKQGQNTLPCHSIFSLF